MADLAQKKGSFIRRFVDKDAAQLNLSAETEALCREWVANNYAEGASPPESNITDADLAAVAPWLTAAQLNAAIGAVTAVNQTVDQQRGYLEAARP